MTGCLGRTFYRVPLCIITILRIKENILEGEESHQTTDSQSSNFLALIIKNHNDKFFIYCWRTE